MNLLFKFNFNFILKMTSYKLAIQTFSKGIFSSLYTLAPIIKFTLNHGENSIGNNQNHTIFI